MIEALAARTAVEADEQIRALIKECEEGRSDRAEEAIEIAKRWDLDEVWVRGCFDDARKVRPGNAPQEEAKEPSRALTVLNGEVLPALSGWDEALEIMNTNHAVIESVGGKTLIAGWQVNMLDPTKMELVYQDKSSFLLRYSHKKVVSGGGNASMPIGQWWLNHPKRAQYRGVIFAPGGEKVINGCVNIWQGWGIEAKEGEWGRIRQHILEVVAGGNEEFAEYITKWIAWAIQNPAAQAEVALVLIGSKGTGKGTLVRCLAPIFGSHTFQVTSQEEVIGKFNGHLQDCILFVADEAYWGGHKQCVGRLQGMLTEPWLPIERKGVDIIKVKNMLHVVMLAEPGWVIPAGRWERRYAAFAVSSVKRGDKGYFRALNSEMAEGGVAAMFYDLGRMDLGDWHPREIPELILKGAALRRQQGQNLQPIEHWFVSLLHEGKLPGAWAKHPGIAFTTELVDDAKRKIPRLRELTEVGLINFLNDAEAIGIPCVKRRTNARNGREFAPLGELRLAWEGRFGPTDWASPRKEWGESELQLLPPPAPVAAKPPPAPKPGVEKRRA